MMIDGKALPQQQTAAPELAPRACTARCVTGGFAIIIIIAFFVNIKV